MSEKELETKVQIDDNKWLDSVQYIVESVLRDQEKNEAPLLLNELMQRLGESGFDVPSLVTTPYINTISLEDQPEYPGNHTIERRIKSYIRWNAMAMVVNANRKHDGLGGHISTFASLATLYEVAFNHFFRGASENRPADIIFFQGHASPGVYSRAYLEGRLSAENLHHFRQELGDVPGLSSYPHPYLMPDFWQYPTVSMGIGPACSIYQARFIRYLRARGLDTREEPRVWAYCGDGEMDEPESVGALTMAARENLDNLTWVVNCNLQRLDGPVRGNAKVIQEFEGLFKGAGWNVIKVIWGQDWDELFKADKTGLLLKRMEECVDGDYQKYSVEPGSYIRKHFFGKYPELLRLVDHMSDDQLGRMLRGGHDSRKVFAAYKAAVEHKGQPTVILAKTVKGYGLGEAGEGRNITHQQKKLNEKELREFRKRFEIPISDEEIAETPFYRPDPESEEAKYLHERRQALGGYLPARKVEVEPLNIPEAKDIFADSIKGSGDLKASSTMAFVRILTKLLRDPELKELIVPIIPDEARTFGMDALFRSIGIYSSKGQLYEPVDSESFLYYKEEKDGQILEEGINEVGSLCSFTAAGTSYATHGVNTIPFYIFYSMFGFQRVGDFIWAAADSRTKGFMLGATAGRTTLNGEGLQHQDGHGLLMASTVPSIMAYDPAFAYELAIIIHDGLRRMYAEGEEIFYYITVYNENHSMPPMPEGVEEGILKGLYRYQKAQPQKHKAHLLASGPIINHAIEAAEILKKYDVSADIWSATSFNTLRKEALDVERWNRFHPEEPAKRSYVESLLADEEGVFVAVSDNVRLVADQIKEWVPGGLKTLGTDGFGRSETREKLREYFEINEKHTAYAVLCSLVEKGSMERSVLKQALVDLNINPDKRYPKF